MCFYERKATCSGAAAFTLYPCYDCDWQACIFIDLTQAWTEMYMWSRDGYTYMDIPHTIIWRSVVLQIPKPEINRPKLVKTSLINQIYGKHLWVLCYWTQHRAEGSIPLSYVRCKTFDILDGLREEMIKNDSMSGKTKRSLKKKKLNSVNSTTITHNLMSRWICIT